MYAGKRQLTEETSGASASSITSSNVKNCYVFVREKERNKEKE